MSSVDHADSAPRPRPPRPPTPSPVRAVARRWARLRTRRSRSARAPPRRSPRSTAPAPAPSSRAARSSSATASPEIDAAHRRDLSAERLRRLPRGASIAAAASTRSSDGRLARLAVRLRNRATAGPACTITSDFIGSAPAGVTTTVYLPGGASGPAPPRVEPQPQIAASAAHSPASAGSRRKSQHARFRPACDGPRNVRTVFPAASQIAICTPPGFSCGR